MGSLTGILLKCSVNVRELATAKRFLKNISSYIDELHDRFGMACGEFIRRHGDSKVSC